MTFRECANALRNQLLAAALMPDAFHVARLAVLAIEEVRCRVQWRTLGHRSRAGDLRHMVRNMSYRATGSLLDRQRADSSTVWNAAAATRDARCLAALLPGARGPRR